MPTFHQAPAKVGAPPGTLGDARKIHFLPMALSYIPDIEIAGGSVEAEAPRISETVAPHLATGPGGPHKRIVGRHGVGSCRRDVDPQDRAEQVLYRLPAPTVVVVAVAQPDVEHAVGSEEDLAAIVGHARAGDKEHF